ncbi:hypothetical protein G7Z17_g7442 [Cylindrodendrum hubeiense]|uniref:DNA mismatch repair protein HSM3 N-terminal domain-containing protein n=1 Tax=Cylindrodendrum hubeiense TaxID=595255 RepID=A0A9P5LE75_9HYPO|nr:hypothetical protein G7Z17_g7442 [Cylindrodendrum hubeiense]
MTPAPQPASVGENIMSQRVVPEYNMDRTTNVPISGLEELQEHIEQLENDPSAAFNAKLFDDVELQLNETNIPPLLPTLLPPLTAILKQTTQDPSPLLSLATKLLSPLPFTRCLTIADPDALVAALTSPVPGAILLALVIIHKAARTPADAALLSTLPEVVEQVLRRWLDSSDVGVAERAGKVLGDLLETDCDIVVDGVNGLSSSNGTSTDLVKRRVPGHARLWRLIFLKRPFLSIITTLCVSEKPDRQVTLAQGRLLRLIPRLAALNPRALTQSPFADLLPVPAPLTEQVGHGLLQWVALSMVDTSDILMHLSLIDFYETFVSVMRVSGQSADKLVRDLVRTAAQNDEQLKAALRGLPDRTVEEEAEPLAKYISQLLD